MKIATSILLVAVAAAAGTLDKTVSRHPLPGAVTTVTFRCHDDGTACAGGQFTSYTANSIHTGYDVDNSADGAVPETRVGAILPGVVAAAPVVTCQSCSGGGNTVVTEHLLDDGSFWYILNLHLLYTDNIQIARLAQGDRVAGSQFVGHKGGTGAATGTHLHVELSRQTTAQAVAECAAHWTPPCVGGVRGPDDPATGSTVVADPLPFLQGQRRALVPYFSERQAAPDESTYRVYGVSGMALYASLPIRPTSTVSFQRFGVGGRDETGAIADVFVRTDNPTFAPGAAPVTGSAVFTCTNPVGCDYKFFTYVRTAQGIDRNGYPMKLTVLPNARSEVLDNDGRNADASCTQSAKPGWYVGCEQQSPWHHGYYLTARLFPSGTAGYFARWFPSQAGRYRVFVHVPAKVPNAATAVTYKIYEHGVGTAAKTTAAVSHDYTSPGTGTWRELQVGAETSWQFDAGGYVGLSTETMAAGQSVAVDAVKFIAVP